MARTVDEILRDAGVTAIERHADRLMRDFHGVTRDIALSHAAAAYVGCPTERAALVEHMVASRDGRE
tara:strand:+ start:13446 stop:13646 length:201 start_codon:yes stop_codon:yes gene_type:complete